ncbi:MAG: Cytochrome c-type biosis protein [Ignavibacteria bacterium]|nr:Cytochrome c-type biosis protein [Ignavibacteria bacterium]
MKPRYIIGFALALVFIVIAIFSLSTDSVSYTGFAYAKNSGKVVQIIGSSAKDDAYKYMAAANIFTFRMKDSTNTNAIVKYNGSVPNNFDIAPMIVVKGKFVRDTFMASDILTKCPSKYESKFEQSKSN